MKNNYQFLIYYLKHYKYNLIVVFLGLVLTSMTTLAIGYKFSKIIKIISSHSNIDNTQNIDLEIIQTNILILIFSIGSFLRSYFINKININIQNNIKIDVYKTLLHKEYSDFQKIPSGYILSIMTQDVKNIGDAIVNFFSFILRNFLMLIGAFILMLITSIKLSISILILFLVLILLIKLLSQKLKILSEKSRNSETENIAKIEENLSAMKILHIFHKQQYSLNDIALNFNNFININSQKLKFRSIFFSFIIIFTLSSLTFVIWLGNREVLFSHIDSNYIISFIYYSVLVAISATSISEVLSQTNDYVSSINRINKFLQKSDLKKPQHANFKLENIPSNFTIKVNNLKYQYDKSKYVVSNLSFQIPESKFIGIIGFSGSGKSSLINLLSRILINYSGNIKIGDIDITEINEKLFRNIVSLVSDEDALFTDTIENNILFVNKENNYDAKEFCQILDLCGINEFTKDFPLGVKTIIGQKHTTISSGQKQKILIARAMLVKPKILLIDEATNSIDIKGENKILVNLKKFLPKTTFIYVTHRTSNLYLTDLIFILHNGKLIEKGIYKDLSKNSDIFQKLVNQKNIS